MGKQENKIQREIIQHINDHLGIGWRNNSGIVRIKQGGALRYMHLAPKGSPDIVACIYGKFVGIEVKTPKGKVESHQYEFGQEIKDSGGEWLVARGLDDFMQQIKELDFSNNIL